ncbi:MAG: outer membrane beta-barrel protein [Candidatus Azobacteroides sp.]|nr:outer membrane beta-barrel protein [Candidatus Azobacteroides sp.]
MKEISKILFVCIVCTFSIGMYGQGQGPGPGPANRYDECMARQIRVSVHYAYSRGGVKDYTNMKPGKSIGVDASYFITENVLITAHFNYLSNRYLEDKLTTAVAANLDDTNASLVINTMGLLVGYNFQPSEWMNITAEAGFAQFIRVKSKFPIRSSDSPIYYDTDLRRVDDTFFSAAFPLKLSIGFRVGEYLELGFTTGLYIDPEFFPSPFVGLYYGPRVSVIF